MDELIDLGMDMARMVHRRAKMQEEAQAEAEAGAEADALGEMAVAFDRVSRAVRRTVNLVRLLDEPVAAVGGGAARRQIIRAVEDRIHEDFGEGEQAESLRAELYERMDGPDLDDDIAGRPVEAIIADIKRDLGIAGRRGSPHPWRRRTPEDVAALCAQAAGVAGSVGAVGAAAEGVTGGRRPARLRLLEGVRGAAGVVRRGGVDPP